MKHQVCPRELKMIALPLGLTVFLCGCSSSSSVSSTGMPDAEYSYREMNEDLKGKDVTIELKDGRDISAKEVKISDDSVSGVEASSDRTFSIVTTEVRTVVDNKHWVGALEGMGFGLLVGGTAGMILNSLPTNASGISFPWEAGAVAGLVVGFIPGIIIGHSYEYEFRTNEQSDSLRNRK